MCGAALEEEEEEEERGVLLPCGVASDDGDTVVKLEEFLLSDTVVKLEEFFDDFPLLDDFLELCVCVCRERETEKAREQRESGMLLIPTVTPTGYRDMPHIEAVPDRPLFHDLHGIVRVCV